MKDELKVTIVRSNYDPEKKTVLETRKIMQSDTKTYIKKNKKEKEIDFGVTILRGDNNVPHTTEAVTPVKEEAEDNLFNVKIIRRNCTPCENIENRNDEVSKRQEVLDIIANKNKEAQKMNESEEKKTEELPVFTAPYPNPIIGSTPCVELNEEIKSEPVDVIDEEDEDECSDEINEFDDEPVDVIDEEDEFDDEVEEDNDECPYDEVDEDEYMDLIPEKDKKKIKTPKGKKKIIDEF